jgi:hypothetical protein
MANNNKTSERSTTALLDAAYAALDSRAVTDAARSLRDDVVDLVAREEMKGRRRKRDRTASRLKRAVEGLLGDLLRAQASGKSQGYVYHPTSPRGFKDAPVGHRVFMAAKDALEALGLVKIAKGFQKWADFGSGKVSLPGYATRFIATPRLLKLAESHGVPLAEARDHFVPELPAHPLQLRAASTRDPFGGKLQGRRLKFDHTPRTEKLEKQVRQLNEFLAGFDIRGGTHRGFIRGFNNGDHKAFDWNKGGRLYSVGDDSYQLLSQEQRLRMNINGEAVCEIDVRASYLTIFHAIHNAPFEPSRDPYELPGMGKHGRSAVKRWFVATFGKNRHLQRWPHQMISEHREETGEELSKAYPVKMIHEKALQAFPVLAKWGEPMGGREIGWADLMFRESQAMIMSMDDLRVHHSVPSLPVHDSLIVPASHVEAAKQRLAGGYFFTCEADPWLVVRGTLAPRREQDSQTAEQCAEGE